MSVDCTSTVSTTRGWKPYGAVKIRPRCHTGSEVKVHPLRQCSEVNLSFELEDDSLPDYEAGQGEAASDSRIASGGLGFVCNGIGDFKTLAYLALGTQATVALDAAATETTKAYKGSPLVVPNIPTSITSIVALDDDEAAISTSWSTGLTVAVGDAVVPTTPNTYWYRAEDAGTTDASTEPTWPTTTGATVEDNGITWRCMGLITLVADTDYTANDFGVDIASAAKIYTGSDNETGVNVTITYAHAAQDVVHSGMNTGQEFEVFFLGKNAAYGDELFLVHIRRVKSASADEIGLVSTEYNGPNTTWKILSDDTASASESKFWNVRRIDT